MDEELIRELQRLYARAVERQYTVKQVKEELDKLGIIPTNSCPAGIMDDIRKLISRKTRETKEARKAAEG